MAHLLAHHCKCPYRSPAHILSTACEFDMSFLSCLCGLVIQELTELRTKKKNLSDNFSMEKRKYKEFKEMKAQKQKEVLTRRKNERFVSQKEM